MRRKFRRGQRHVEGFGLSAEESLEQHLFQRLTRLGDVKRFVIAWILLLVLSAGLVTLQTRALSNYYQAPRPVPGGTYSEGMVGNFTNANPLYATGLVDSTVSRLVFAGLFKYGADNKLIGDLADGWSVDSTGKVYTVTLRPNLAWQDGQPLTAEDVEFTFRTIQNPDAGSPLFSGWRGITVKADNPRTVKFTLENSFAPFIYSLTTGIVPQHILKSLPTAQLRSSLFNTAHPVGAGPFAWDTIETDGNSPETRHQHIGLKAFSKYHGGTPALQRFIVSTYASQDQLVEGFQKQQVSALVGLDHLPDELIKDPAVQEYSVPLTAEDMVFFKTDSELLKDNRVRQALVEAVSVPTVTNGLGYPVIMADEPLLRGQIGYNPTLRQLATNVQQAQKLLDDAGWKVASPGQTRSNGPAKLDIKLIAQNNADYVYITQQLKKAWSAIGVNAQVTLLSDSDLQSSINSRSYDMLLNGISMGTDPDVFAYWHSTQADPRAANRLNFSDYKSAAADKSLESGRNRLDPELRAAKYVPFLQAWHNDAPALALYQPRFLYITRGPIAGFEATTINNATDRFANVENWMIRQEHSVKAD